MDRLMIVNNDPLSKDDLDLLHPMLMKSLQDLEGRGNFDTKSKLQEYLERFSIVSNGLLNLPTTYDVGDRGKLYCKHQLCRTVLEKLKNKGENKIEVIE